MIDEKLLKPGVVIEMIKPSDVKIFDNGAKLKIISTDPIKYTIGDYRTGTIMYVCKNLSTNEINHFWPGCKFITDDFFKIIEYENYEIY